MEISQRCTVSARHVFWSFLFVYGVTSQSVEKDPNYWHNEANKVLDESLRLQPNMNVAKNIIFFIGDGLGIPTVTAARIYKGQLQNESGENAQLSFEKFPYVALAKTYCVDKQVPDSAATATAFLTGVKTNFLTLGVNAQVIHNNCSTVAGNEVSSILQWAQEAGKNTGFVTTTTVTHATPAALYAHTPNRNWESDTLKADDADACKDIARQLVEDIPGRDIKVILGGGRQHFLTADILDKESNKFGYRKDQRNLASAWIMDKINRQATYKYVTNTKEFQNVDTQKVDYLLGLFKAGHMQYELDRNTGNDGEPSLTEMTKTAIKVLQKGSEGYFLFVEGGKIDHAHHSANAKRALIETVSFDSAIQAAVDLTDPKDTLIVVSADHSHVMAINGYPQRGHSILGTAGISDIDKLAYTTLMYTNGPGFVTGEDGKRPNITELESESNDYKQQGAVPMKTETHGGEDVAIYAMGPMAHLFHGVQEQNYIPHALAYASCVGQRKDHCKKELSYQALSKAASLDSTLIRAIILMSSSIYTALCLT